jgi:hypothetical protein
MFRAAAIAMTAFVWAASPMAQAPAAPVAPVAPAAPSAPVAPDAQAIGTMSELMVQMIYPTSDAIFYISTRTPKTDQEWLELQAKTLTLAESGNLLMLPSRARGRPQWLKDARLMLDAGWAAFKAAKAKDVAALEALSDQLYESCTTCHQHFRPNYGKRPPPPGR